MSSSRGWLALTGCALYLVVLGGTAGYHVLRNDALDLVDLLTAGAAQAWRAYAGPRLVLSHVRTAAAALGAAALVASPIADR